MKTEVINTSNFAKPTFPLLVRQISTGRIISQNCEDTHAICIHDPFGKDAPFVLGYELDPEAPNFLNDFELIPNGITISFKQ